MCSYFFPLSLATRQHLLCLFPLIFHFSGLEQDDSKYIDISRTFAPTFVINELLSAFKRSGFANQSVGEYKLLPCSLGWFVNASSEDNNCKECPAGKLPLNLADNTSTGNIGHIPTWVKLACNLGDNDSQLLKLGYSWGKVGFYFKS